MKKKKFRRLLTIVAAVCILTVFAVCLCSCGKKDEAPANSGQLSYVIRSLYSGTAGGYGVDLEFGSKETDFIADGKVADVKDFTRLSVSMAAVGNYGDTLPFVLKIGEGEVRGVLNMDRIKKRYVSEVSTGDIAGEPTFVTLGGDNGVTVELSDSLKGKLNWQDALNIANGQFSERIAEAGADGTFEREIIVKPVESGEGGMYWYVAYLAPSESSWALLIDPEDGDILAKK